MSEFKPGDVGMVCLPDGTEVRAMLDEEWAGRSVWRGWDGRSGDAKYAEVRPLVVIDPEDREQVERLMTLYAGSPLMDDEVPDMQAALREFASPTPPKPDEPLGLGAVVTDIDGKRWVRCKTWQQTPWRECDPENGDLMAPRSVYYASIDAVTVLSEGVPS